MSLSGDMSDPLDPIFVVEFFCCSFLSQLCCAHSWDLIDFADWHRHQTIRRLLEIKENQKAHVNEFRIFLHLKREQSGLLETIASSCTLTT